MYRDNDNFIDQLRKEANDVKSCFTSFSFQAIAFSVVIMGAVVKFQPSQPYIGFAGLPVIIILLAVCRIGNYKYGTANRHYGFELFMDFMKKRDSNFEICFTDWEGLLRAWRIVQPTILEEIYYTRLNTRWYNFLKRWNYNIVKKEFCEKQLSQQSDTSKFRSLKDLKKFPWWFNPSSIVKDISKDVLWYPGRYLHTMQNVLQLIAVFALIPVIVIPLQFQFVANFQKFPFNESSLLGIKILAFISGLIILLSTIAMVISIRHIISRRNMLESGLLCIHSCAVVWQIVYLAHLKALDAGGNSQHCYMQELAEKANEIRKNAADMFKWADRQNR